MLSQESLLGICTKTENRHDGEDATIKYVLRTRDNNFFESVLIFENTLTLCLSSQIGCNVKCGFCITGRDAFKRNLTTEEILGQVNVIEKDYGRKIECVSYMGMGEPALNLQNVMETMKIFHSVDKKIKISTSGIPGTIKKLADSDVPLDLYFSLHVADEEKRSKLIPLSKSFRLEGFVQEMNYFSRMKHDGIIIWYLMLDGVNDTQKDAEDLIAFLKRLDNVKLVYVKDYCETGLGFRKTSPEKLHVLADILRNSGFQCKVSVSSGQKIGAGCGQLRQRVISNNLINIGNSSYK